MTNGYNQQSPGMVQLKNVLADVGWTVLRSSDGTTKVESDGWTELSSANAAGAWCLLSNQNDSLQALLWKGGDGSANFAWSPGRLYTAGTGVDRPTATDEVPVLASTGIGLVDPNETSGTFVAISGTYGDERYTRVLLVYSNKYLYGLYCFEHLHTDLTLEELPDNRCTVWGGLSGLYRSTASNGPYFSVTMTDGSHPRLYDLNSAHSNAKPLDGVGSLDSVARASPIYVCHSRSEAQLFESDLASQAMGFVPDMFWTANRGPSSSYYDVQSLWTQLHEVILPSLGDVPYFDDGGTVTARALSPLGPGGAQQSDTDPPSVALESPSESVKIQPSSTIIMRVTDAVSLRSVNIFVDYPDAPTIPCETVYNSRGFEPVRYGSSSRTELGENADYRYYIRRTGGWPSNPRILVDPIDRGGNAIE